MADVCKIICGTNDSKHCGDGFHYPMAVTSHGQDHHRCAYPCGVQAERQRVLRILDEAAKAATDSGIGGKLTDGLLCRLRARVGGG